MNRRDFFSVSTLALIAGCTGKLPTLPVDMKVSLPAEISEAVEDVQAIITKVKSLGTSVPALAVSLVDKAKALIAGIDISNAATVLADTATTLAPIVSLLGPQWGLVAKAIATLLPMIGGYKVAGRTGMSPAQARAVLRS